MAYRYAGRPVSGTTLTFIAGRALQAVIVLFGVSALVFFSLYLTGDPALLMLPPEATAEEIAAFRQAMGFDQPVYVQYGHFLAGLLHGDLGNSLRFQRPAMELVLDRLPATAILAIAALTWSTLLGLALGIVAAVWRGTILDYLARIVAVLGQAIPVFWLALLLIIIFSLKLHWLPSGGIGGLSHLILPTIALGAYYLSAVSRLVRSSLIETLAQDYVRTAWAKGLSSWRVVMRHALRNALIPVVTVQGMQFAALLGGALITEMVFAWPGIGRLAVQAIQTRDFPLVQAVVILIAFIFTLMNFLIDLLYLILNPRIRI